MEKTRRIISWLPRVNRSILDTLIGLSFATIAVLSLESAAGSEQGFRDVDSLGTILVLLQTLPLGLRRVAPIGSLAVIIAAIGLHAALGYDHIEAGTLASLVAVSSAAYYVTDLRRAVVAGVLAAVGIGVFYATTRNTFDNYQIIGTAGLWLAGWTVGSTFRIRRRHSAVLASALKVSYADLEK